MGWFLLRRRRKMLRDVARKEEPTFVDLDGDEDGQDAAGLMATRRGRASRASHGVSQSYQVSPYMHGSSPSPSTQTVQESSRPQLSALDTGSTYGYALGSPSRPLSTASHAAPVSPSTVHCTAGTRPQSASGLSSRYPPGSRPWSASGLTDTHQGTPYSHAGSEPEQNGSPVSHSFGPGSAGHGGYRLSARNGEPSEAPPLPPVPALPAKRPLPARPGTGDSRRSQRVVQHSDAGPLPAPSSDDGQEPEEAVVEVSSLRLCVCGTSRSDAPPHPAQLPPSYAPDWSDRNPHAA